MLPICLSALGIVVGWVVFIGLVSLGTYALSCNDYHRPPLLLGEAPTHPSSCISTHPSISAVYSRTCLLDHKLISSSLRFAGLYAGYVRYSTLSDTSEQKKKEEEEVQTGSNPLQNSVDFP